MLAELLKYNYQMNRNLIAALKKLPLVPETSHKLLAHIINAHSVWNGRIEGLAPDGVWEIHTLDILEKNNHENLHKSLSILESKSLEDLILYCNSQGESFESYLCDIIYHIINHASYHRGQIATDCKNYGVAPLVTDYIFHKRKPV